MFKDLSKKEKEVLTIFSKGVSNVKIAKAMGVTTNTVRYHLKSIYNKLDITGDTANLKRMCLFEIVLKNHL